MKIFIPALLGCLICSLLNAAAWTAAQLQKANTAAAITGISQVEKDAIKYINLARLYPKQFAENEVKNYYGPAKYGDYLKNSTYRTSLMTTLKNMQAVGALTFNQAMYDNAKCLRVEQGKSGAEGHVRVNCTKKNWAECCSYGMDTGKDIALQWLIDDKISSLGHRKICLDGKYTKTGLSAGNHKKWGSCAVAEFI
jgi:hypothetical protein